MDHAHAVDRLAALEATVAILQARLSAREATPRRRRTRPDRRPARALAALALALLVALIPLGLLAAPPFNDLTGGIHDANIQAIYAAGITKGCVPDVSYCPTDNVTRQEMASFLARTAGLGGNPPVANALTAVTATSAQNAATAQTLQGKVPADFLASDGNLYFNYSFYNVVSDASGLGIDYGQGPVVTLDPTTNGGKQVRLALDAPDMLFGRTLYLASVRVCYERVGGAYIYSTGVFSGINGQGKEHIFDSTDRTSGVPACYTLTLPPQEVVLGALILVVNMEFPNNATDSMRLYSVRLALKAP